MGRVNSRERSFSLLELMVVLAIGASVIGPTLMVLNHTMRGVSMFAEECATTRSIVLALERLGGDVRSAASVDLAVQDGRDKLVLSYTDRPAATWTFVEAAAPDSGHGRLRRTVAGGQALELPLRGAVSVTFSRTKTGGVLAVVRIAAEVNDRGGVLSPETILRAAYSTRCEAK